MLPVPGVTLTAEYPKAARTAIQARPMTAAAVRTRLRPPSARENVDMRAVSQELVDFANSYRQPPAPGFVIASTPRYQVTLQPDLPIPGPNSVSYIRCRAEDADQLIDEVRAIVKPHRLPVMWILDPGTEPDNMAEILVARGMSPDAGGPEVAVMVLPIEARIVGPDVPGLEIQDALADAGAFNAADRVNREAFQSSARPDLAANERRRKNQLAAGNRRLLLATVDGEPGGSAGISLFPPVGAIINGGAVRPKFRGRGVYRAMVAARLAMGREAGVSGLVVWGGHMSGPILGRLGFETVGWRRFYVDLASV